MVLARYATAKRRIEWLSDMRSFDMKDTATTLYMSHSDIPYLVDVLQTTMKRIGALEKAMKNTYDAPSTGCAVCVHHENNQIVCIHECKNKSEWQFDQARFSEKDGGEGIVRDED